MQANGGFLVSLSVALLGCKRSGMHLPEPSTFNTCLRNVSIDTVHACTLLCHVCAAMKVRLKFGSGGSNGGMEH
jgi:hypothetical protein